MASSLDPESEALIRQLHRELNGLTRRSRHQPTENLGLRRLVSESKVQNKGGSATHSEHSSERAVASRPASEGEPGSVDHKPPAKPKPKRSERPEATERPTKLARKSSPVPHQQQQPQQQPRPSQQQQQQQQQSNKQKAAPTAAPATQAAPAADKVGATPSPAAAPAATPPTPPAPLSPLEEAAAVASSMTKTKVKQAPATRSVGARTVKCFHAGVRWGVTLSTDALKKRSDLAAALNDAYAGQILSCGRGEGLHVLFLDGDGNCIEFPALRSDTKESATKWRTCVDKAVRVYIMR